MMNRALCLIALGILASTGVRGAEAWVRLVVVGGFGQERTSCEVESFRNLDEPLVDGGYRDYKSLFRGLEARGIPYARYEASVRCGERYKGSRDVQIDVPDDFEVIATSERLFRTHDRKPDLRISLRLQRRPNETWWVRMVGMYVASDLSARFAVTSAPTILEATVFDPQPGRYMVFVYSDLGFSCSRRIDVYDAPRHWKFDPVGCLFEVDEKAKLVTEP